MKFKDEFSLNVEAQTPLIQIVSHETLRIQALCQRVANDLTRAFYCWDCVHGLRLAKSDGWELQGDTEQPHEVLDWIQETADEHQQGMLLLLEDFHPYIDAGNVMAIARLRAFAVSVTKGEIRNVTLVLSQPSMFVPQELEKETVVMELPFPDVHELMTIAKQVKQRYGLSERDFQPTSSVLEAALGLSTTEAQLAFARAACKYKRLTPKEIPFVLQSKEQVIRKNGQLEYFHPQSTISDVGGLEVLKNWLERRQDSFSEEARDFGLEMPRGVLLLGLPGTGKSLAAKSIANLWQLPLLRLDMGRVFGGIVGQSEANIRTALQTAEALSPCVLWIDEIEKGLSGVQSSGSTDGGTTSRVLGSFLTWMQEKKKPVFVVATANDISQLPPELLRKGRLDEIFFVDLPTVEERRAIIKIHLTRRRAQSNFTDNQIQQIANASAMFTGAEIEEVVKEGMFMAFHEGRELESSDLLTAIEKTSPLAWTMYENIGAIRQWAKGRALRASLSAPEPLIPPKSKVPRLRQEKNMFFED